ncbi:MAG TPA: helix-turn-helix domain-containing protein, partial [Chryseobacterium sp.]
KKTTVEETYDLWIEKNSVQDIARIRKLTAQTIETHLVKLIQAKKIELSDVLPYDKILALREAFQFYQEESLNGLKEKHGDEFTWDELKMFKASIN